MNSSWWWTVGAVFGVTLPSLLGLAAALSLLPRKANDSVTRVPWLDLIVSLYTWIPWVAGGIAAGWAGLAAALAAQWAALGIWCVAHELAHRDARRGPRIVKVLNRTVGRLRNHAALWVTTVALPVFLLIRAMQVGLYWLLPALLGFPRYRQSDWVNCSRQKFDGLVGHDLIWCLYCDWMTGVYSLGAEMLRNVESFWCPIRFYDGKKCENCRVDFPDIDGGWVPADGTMAEVAAVLEEKYSDGRREWFGHPARLTVRGREVEPGVRRQLQPIQNGDGG
jgi:type IV secretory pathway TrbD component